jgi:hypothetical protein
VGDEGAGMTTKPVVKDETPLAWFLLAHAFLYDAAMLNKAAAARRSGGHFESPVRFLYFHAIELFLKTYLRQRGFKEAVLKYKPYGHHLNVLATEAATQGLRVTRRVQMICDGSAAFDDPFEARYLRTGAKFKFPPNRLHEAARDLQTAVEQALKADGVLIQPLDKLPVVHPPRLTPKRAMRRLRRRGLAS